MAAWAVLHQLSSLPNGAAVPKINVPSGPPSGPGETCPADNSCPPDQQPPPAPQCDQNSLQLVTLFDPCDPNFCENIQTFVDAFTEFGQAVLGALGGVDSLSGFFDTFVNLVGSVSFIGGFLKKLLTPIADNMDVITKLVCSIKSLLATQIVKQQDAVIGISICKTVVECLNRVRGGIDPGVWLTTDLSFEIPLLSEILDKLMAYASQTEVPSLQEALNLYYSCQIGPQTLYCYGNMDGYCNDLIDKYVQADREQPTPDDFVRYSWRINDQQNWTDTKLQQLGWVNQDDRDTFKLMRVEPPSPAELLAFARREVFRVDKLGIDEMQREFLNECGLREMFFIGGIQPIQFQVQDWSNLPAAEETCGALPPIFRDQGNGLFTFDSPLAFWLEHYTEISQGQGAEGLHRLRPNRVRRFRSFVPGKTPDDLVKLIPFADFELAPDGSGTYVIPKPWTSFEQAKLLRQLEYNPVERGLLEAISYRVLGRIDVRRIYFSGGFGQPNGRKAFTRDQDGNPIPSQDAEKELVERFMDQGYTREDSYLQAYNLAYQYEIQYVGDPIKQQITTICTAITLGVIDIGTATDRLKEILGSQELATQEITKCVVKMRSDDLKKAQAAVRKLYMSGAASEQEVNAMLQGIGVVQERADQIVSIWKVERAGMSRQASAEKLCQWHGKGLISTQEMIGRLQRLNWNDDDIQRIVSYCILGELAAQQKEVDKRIQAEAKAEAQKQKQIQQALDKQQRAAEKAFAAATKLETEKNVSAWWKAGIIGPETVAKIWLMKGNSQADVIRWMEQNAPPPPSK